MSISIDDYCKNPSAYKDKLPDSTISFYDSLCSVRQDSQSGFNIIIDEFKDLGNILGNKDTYNKIFGVLSQFIENMIKGLTDPKNLGIMLAMNKSIGPKLLNFIAQGIKNIINNVIESIGTTIVEGNVEEIVADLVEEGVSEAAVNISLITEGLFETIGEIFGDVLVYSALGFLYALRGLAQFVEFINPLLIVLLIVVMAVQMISQIIDTWDPCGFNNLLSADALVLFSNSFDKAFREQVMTSADSIVDPFGNMYFINIWPLEFDIMSSGLLDNEKKDYYKPIKIQYLARWYNSREFNSDGVPIFWPKGGSILNKDVLSNILSLVETELSNQNTVVASWIDKYWPMILGLALLLILFIIFYSINSKK